MKPIELSPAQERKLSRITALRTEADQLDKELSEEIKPLLEDRTEGELVDFLVEKMPHASITAINVFFKLNAVRAAKGAFSESA